jgi:hypothetical protein
LGKKEQWKYKKTYTAHDIVISIHSDCINKKVAKLSKGAKLGSPDWLKHYPDAVTYVISKLSREEQAEVDRTINEWEVSGPPDGVKSALAEKKFGLKIKDTIKELQKTMGVQIFVMAGYRRPNGQAIKVQ